MKYTFIVVYEIFKPGKIQHGNFEIFSNKKLLNYILTRRLIAERNGFSEEEVIILNIMRVSKNHERIL